MRTWKRETIRLGAMVLFLSAMWSAFILIDWAWGEGARAFANSVVMGGLVGWIWDWPRRPKAERARTLLAGALRLHPRTVVEFGAAGVVGAGFTLHKDGKEFGVFLNGERIKPPNTSPPMTGGRGAEPPCSSGSTGDEMNPSPRDEKWKS